MADPVKFIVRAVDEASQTIDKIGKSISTMSKNAEASSKKLAIGLAAVGTVVAGVGIKAIASASEFEKLRISYVTLLGDSEEAADSLLAQLDKFAATTPFQLKDLQQMAPAFIAAGVPAGEIVGHMQNLGDIAAGTNADLGRLVTNFLQIKTVGKASMMDIRQFAMAGIPIYDALSQSMGKTNDEISDMITKGTIGFKEINDAVKLLTDPGIKNAEGGFLKFGGLMQAQSDTIAGAWSNMQDSITIKMRELGFFLIDTFEEIGIDIKQIIKNIADSISNLDFNAFKKSLKENAVLVVALAGAVTFALLPALAAAATAAWALIAPLIPFLAIGAAVGVLVYELAESFGLSFGDMKDIAVGTFKVISIALKKFGQFMFAGFKMIQIGIQALVTGFVQMAKWGVQFANLFGADMDTSGLDAMVTNGVNRIQELGSGFVDLSVDIYSFGEETKSSATKTSEGFSLMSMAGDTFSKVMPASLTKVADSSKATTKSLTEDTDKIKDNTKGASGSYKNANEQISKELDSLTTKHESAMTKLQDGMKKTKAELQKLISEFKNFGKTQGEDFGSKFQENAQAIKELEDEISKGLKGDDKERITSDELQEKTAQLEKLKSAQREFNEFVTMSDEQRNAQRIQSEKTLFAKQRELQQIKGEEDSIFRQGQIQNEIDELNNKIQFLSIREDQFKQFQIDASTGVAKAKKANERGTMSVFLSNWQTKVAKETQKFNMDMQRIVEEVTQNKLAQAEQLKDFNAAKDAMISKTIESGQVFAKVQESNKQNMTAASNSIVSDLGRVTDAANGANVALGMSFQSAADRANFTPVRDFTPVQYGASGSFATGGIVKGSNGLDNLTANVSAGELILNKAQQSNLASNMTQGGGNNVTINISAGNVVGDLDEFADTLGDKILKTFQQHTAFQSF
jgi:tape measure domain-containing protein